MKEKFRDIENRVSRSNILMFQKKRKRKKVANAGSEEIKAENFSNLLGSHQSVHYRIPGNNR